MFGYIQLSSFRKKVTIMKSIHADGRTQRWTVEQTVGRQTTGKLVNRRG